MYRTANNFHLRICGIGLDETRINGCFRSHIEPLKDSPPLSNTQSAGTLVLQAALCACVGVDSDGGAAVASVALAVVVTVGETVVGVLVDSAVGRELSFPLDLLQWVE